MNDIIRRLPPVSMIGYDSLHVVYNNGTTLIVPYLSRLAAEEFLETQEGVVDAFTMSPGRDWKDF